MFDSWKNLKWLFLVRVAIRGSKHALSCKESLLVQTWHCGSIDNVVSLKITFEEIQHVAKVVNVVYDNKCEVCLWKVMTSSLLIESNLESYAIEICYYEQYGIRSYLFEWNDNILGKVKVLWTKEVLTHFQRMLPNLPPSQPCFIHGQGSGTTNNNNATLELDGLLEIL